MEKLTIEVEIQIILQMVIIHLGNYMSLEKFTMLVFLMNGIDKVSMKFISRKDILKEINVLVVVGLLW